MALLSVVTVIPDGVDIAAVAAGAGGDEFPNDGNTYFIMINGDASPHTPTFDSPNDDNFGITDPAHDAGNAVAAGETRMFGPFRKDRFNDANDRVQVTYDAVTSVTVSVVKPTSQP